MVFLFFVFFFFFFFGQKPGPQCKATASPLGCLTTHSLRKLVFDRRRGVSSCRQADCKRCGPPGHCWGTDLLGSWPWVVLTRCVCALPQTSVGLPDVHSGYGFAIGERWGCGRVVARLLTCKEGETATNRDFVLPARPRIGTHREGERKKDGERKWLRERLDAQHKKK